ncbi:MAG TPA: C69 family dipeptidase [Candidatus Limnocylindria bacterium]|nr:C69 family dipeptidase [Candidatus Limnocylindria bacterium]
MGCDTLVALGAATRDGVTLFGKNSDRPPDECQGIVQLARTRHPPGSVVRCQYIEVPQAAETAALVGSQPHWCWGFEHGVNEHRVAIGNEMVFAREPLGSSGLTGMDLVRLGLERGRDADEALEVMTTLLERYGQGGSGQRDVDWPYHNAFLIADPHRAWILETSARHWVAAPVRETGNISNGLAIGAEWTRAASDVTAFAVARGWWPAAGGRLDFARAYGDDAGVPPNLCAARRARLAALLVEGRGRLTASAVRSMLRDHYDERLHRPRPFDDPHHFSVCMHSPGLSHTTAAMVAPLVPDARPAAVWACLGNPCLGVFLPLYQTARIPPRLAAGGREPDATSPWWAAHRLRSLVERDPERLAPRVRARWDELEAALTREAAELEARAAPPSELTAFMERAVDRYLAHADALGRELAV